MTDKDALLLYRLKQAEETLSDAERMYREGNFSSRSIVNRAYYSTFYVVLALFLKVGINIKTSKHIGVISIFDREFIKTGKIDKYYSAILHKMFNVRQKVDYKELVEISSDEVGEYVNLAKNFFDVINGFIEKAEG